MGTEDEKQETEAEVVAGEELGNITYRDVLLTLAMDQLQTGERVDVIATLTSLGMQDIIETAKIAQEVDEEDDEEPPDSMIEGSTLPEEPETSTDSELE